MADLFLKEIMSQWSRDVNAGDIWTDLDTVDPRKKYLAGHLVRTFKYGTTQLRSRCYAVMTHSLFAATFFLAGGPGTFSWWQRDELLPAAAMSTGSGPHGHR
jgi:hypothetical protein